MRSVRSVARGWPIWGTSKVLPFVAVVGGAVLGGLAIGPFVPGVHVGFSTGSGTDAAAK